MITSEFSIIIMRMFSMLIPIWWFEFRGSVMVGRGQLPPNDFKKGKNRIFYALELQKLTFLSSFQGNTYSGKDFYHMLLALRSHQLQPPPRGLEPPSSFCLLYSARNYTCSHARMHTTLLPGRAPKILLLTCTRACSNFQSSVILVFFKNS